MDRVDIKTRLIPLLLLGLAVGSLYAEAPTITKHRVFSIPFFISDKSLTPGEVFLFVSGDQGRNWKLYQRRAPKVAKFDFQAGVDGEYWFVVGTDRNQFVPKEGTDPDKKVIVDNRQPTINLQLESSSDGRIRATWKSYDTTLNAKSFRLSYRTTASPNWKALEVVLPDQLEDAFDGEASWMVADQDGTVEVTAQISDMAENEATVTRSLSFDDSLELVAEERTNDLRSSTSFVSSKTSRETHRPDNNDREQFGVWTSDTNEFDSTPLPWRNPLNSDADSDLLDPTLPLASFKESSTEPELPDPMGYTGESNQNESSTTPSDDQRAEAETILYSNSRQFNLEYDIADLDGELERVELWITQDGGKHWEPYGLDEDLVSPILVEVESEGQYGFRMLLHSQNGTSNRPPQNSDRPDVTIERRKRRLRRAGKHRPGRCLAKPLRAALAGQPQNNNLAGA